MEPTLANMAIILIATAMVVIGGTGAIFNLVEGLFDAFSEKEDR